ncbi:MAG: LysE family translocator [Burkholderiales bacterium]|nr:LysE family translocator [Burkholderiales bacterium]MBI3729793.1 LysE family translocator [Burkholderiales bacterium]
MISLSTLATFSIAVLLLLCSPGPNMAFVMTCGMQYGVRGGVAAALGIGAADIILTLLTACGITALITAWPPSFDLIRYAGAVYLLWMAYKALRNPASAIPTTAQTVPLRIVFARSCLNSLLNPKALLFFMVFLPQFVDAQAGMVTQQLLLLGLTLTIISSVFHALLGSFGHVIRHALMRHTKAARLQARILAAVLSLLALRLLLMTR